MMSVYGKRFLIAILCVVFSFSASLTAAAEADNDAEMTRLEAVVFILDCMGCDVDEKYADYNPFSDVRQGTEKYLGYAYSLSVVKGTAEGIFDGDRKVTREEFLTMVLRLLRYKDVNNYGFSCENPYERAYLSGIYDASDSEGDFTRGEARKIMAKAFFAYRQYNPDRFCDMGDPGEEIAEEVQKEAEVRSAYTDALSKASANLFSITYTEDLPYCTILFGRMDTPHGGSGLGYVVYKNDGTSVSLKLPMASIWVSAEAQNIHLNDEKSVLYYSAFCENDIISLNGELLQKAGNYEYMAYLKLTE